MSTPQLPSIPSDLSSPSHPCSCHSGHNDLFPAPQPGPALLSPGLHTGCSLGLKCLSFKNPRAFLHQLLPIFTHILPSQGGLTASFYIKMQPYTSPPALMTLRSCSVYFFCLYQNSYYLLTYIFFLLIMFTVRCSLPLLGFKFPEG